MIRETNPKREEIMVRGRQNTAVRKKQIMDAARKLIMRSGSEHVTVRNMAKEVGISHPALRSAGRRLFLSLRIFCTLP